MTPDEFERRFGAPLSAYRNIAYGFAALSMLLLAENARLRSLEGPLVIDDGHMKHIRNERIKIQATFLNTIGAGFAVTGVIGPVATYLYGSATKPDRPAWQLLAEIISLLAASGFMHWLANVSLGRLEP